MDDHEHEDTPGSGSPLSDIDSDEFTEEKFTTRSRSRSLDSNMSDGSETLSTWTPQHRDIRSAKRRRTGPSSYDHATPQSAQMIPPPSPAGSISSDTSGSVPTSPSFAHLGPTHPLSTAYAAAQANPENPDSADYIQQTRCMWEGCPEPEQGNMDNLVAHINEVHIVPRQKKYFCEWEGCARKSAPHTSAYALKAHMRSHTKEKPFLCVLPECDRSFTRSDALAKHMRTVHETEALRPSDPVPRGHTGGISNGGAQSNGGIKRIKLVFGASTNGEKRPSIIGELPPLPVREGVGTSDYDKSDGVGEPVDMDSMPFPVPVPEDYYPPDVWASIDEDERQLPPSQYYRLLRRQILWAEQENRELEADLEEARALVGNPHGTAYASGTGQERAIDTSRRRAWREAEHLVDSILGLELSNVVEDSAQKAATERAAQMHTGTGSAWYTLKALDGLVITGMATTETAHARPANGLDVMGDD